MKVGVFIEGELHMCSLLRGKESCLAVGFISWCNIYYAMLQFVNRCVFFSRSPILIFVCASRSNIDYAIHQSHTHKSPRTIAPRGNIVQFHHHFYEHTRRVYKNNIEVCICMSSIECMLKSI